SLPESRAALVRALEIDRGLLADQPNSEHRFQLAIALLHSSAFYQTPDTLESGIAQLQQSLTLFDQLASEGLSSLDFRTQHAFAHKRMGAVVSFVRHDYAAGGRNYREALAIDQSLVDEHPERADLRYNLTQTQNDLAVVDTEEGRFDEALTGIHRALATREAMLASDPGDARTRDGVASALQTLCDVLTRQKHYPEALAAATRSVEIAESGSRTESIRIARGWYRIGNANLGWAKTAPAASRAHLDQAGRYLEQARVFYRKQRGLGPNDAGMEKSLDRLLAEVAVLRRR
ncbi:MAG TPA: tetratricopeptide repeat protein, partial [Bryobacteraceae bacterium]